MRTLASSFSSLSLVLLLACGDSGQGTTETASTDGAQTSSEPTSGPTTSPPTTNEAESETGTSTTHELCERYLDCIAVASPETLPTAQMGFGEGGTCWQGNADTAQQCIEACQAGLEQYNEAYPDEPKCGLCQAHDECDATAGELCHLGKCTVTTCSDGIVDEMEICDSQPGCDDDCQGPRECNPLTNYGCPLMRRCEVTADYVDGEIRGVPNCSQFPGWVAEGEPCGGEDNNLCDSGLAGARDFPRRVVGAGALVGAGAHARAIAGWSGAALSPDPKTRSMRARRSHTTSSPALMKKIRCHGISLSPARKSASGASRTPANRSS